MKMFPSRTGIFFSPLLKIKRLPLAAFATIFVVLACASLIAVNGWRSWNSRAQHLHDAQISATNLARALSHHTEDAIHKADADLISLVERIEVDGTHPGQLARINRLLKTRAAQLPDIHKVLLVDESGRGLAASVDALLTTQLNFSDREYFQFHRLHPDRRAHIAPQVESRANGEWIITVTRRINHADGSFAGVALAAITMNYFQKFYDGFDMGHAGVISMTLDNGTVLAHRPFNTSMSGKSFAFSTLFRDSKTPNGSALPPSSMDGVDRLQGYRHLDHFPILVVSDFSKKEVLSDWWNDTIQHAVNVAILTLIFCWLGLRLAGQIKKLAQTKEALVANEKRLRLITDNLPMAVAYIDTAEKIKFSNKIFTEYLDQPLEQILGQSFETLLGVHYAERVPYIKTVLTGQAVQFERTETFHGREAHLNTSFIPDRDAQGKIKGFYDVTIDVTARKNAELALQASEFRWKFALEGAGQGVWDWHNRTGVVLYSKRWKEMLGYHEEEIESSPAEWARLVHPLDKEKAIADFKNYVRGNLATLTNEHRMLCKDGSWKWVLIRGMVVSRDADGKPQRTIGTTTDITERRQSAEALQQSHEQLRRLSDHQEHIKEKERIRIARDIHDDLGQNLLALKVDVSMLHTRTMGTHPRLNERVHLALLTIDATILSVRAIINDLRPAALELGFHAAAEWQLKQYERMSGIACKLVAADTDFDLDCGLDEKQTTAIFRILQESLANIARHAQATAVGVTLHRNDHHFSMSVSDNGKGIDPRDRRKLNAFGLLGIKERIYSLGGEMIIDSILGSGTKLTIVLPLKHVLSDEVFTE